MTILNVYAPYNYFEINNTGRGNVARRNRDFSTSLLITNRINRQKSLSI